MHIIAEGGEDIAPFTEITLKNIYFFQKLGLDAYLSLSGVGLDAYFKRVVVGRGFGQLWGKGSRFFWEIYARMV